MLRKLLFYTLTSVVLLLNGCSSSPGAYQQQGKKNLTVNVKADSSTYLEVYELDGPCNQKMKGEVKLQNGINKFALMNNKHYYLRINFKTVSLLSGSQNITLGAYVTPKSNYIYSMNAVYEDDMYDVEIKKRNIHSHKATRMTIKPLETCKEKDGKPFISIEWLPALNKSVEVL
ncbi:MULTISPECIES: hypothetical protein [Sulfurovum]|uniref:Lipoprotein n=1 Tax=Sulfurovum xiamenensis TaxID=3019066 RepID=A0ABT7QRX6_9BACT|nr:MULTISPECIES: hypothetical protein [Sulfurovum]MDM5263836.1 hypothetical protein [Sulfurovum xiamenensis]